MESSRVEEGTEPRRVRVHASRNDGKNKTRPISLDSEARSGSAHGVVID